MKVIFVVIVVFVLFLTYCKNDDRKSKTSKKVVTTSTFEEQKKALIEKPDYAHVKNESIRKYLLSVQNVVLSVEKKFKEDVQKYRENIQQQLKVLKGDEKKKLISKADDEMAFFEIKETTIKMVKNTLSQYQAFEDISYIKKAILNASINWPQLYEKIYSIN